MSSPSPGGVGERESPNVFVCTKGVGWGEGRGE